MSFEAMLASDVGNIFLSGSDFGRTIEYTAAGGDALQIQGIVEELTEEDLMKVSVAANYRSKKIHVSVADIGQPKRLGVINEAGGDAVVLPVSIDPEEKTWYVRHILSNDGFVYVLLIVDSRAGYKAH